MSAQCLLENSVLPPAMLPSVKGWWSWSLAAIGSAAAIGFCVWVCHLAEPRNLPSTRSIALPHGTFSFGLSADGNTLAVGAAGESGSRGKQRGHSTYSVKHNVPFLFPMSPFCSLMNAGTRIQKGGRNRKSVQLCGTA